MLCRCLWWYQQFNLLPLSIIVAKSSISQKEAGLGWAQPRGSTLSWLSLLTWTCLSYQIQIQIPYINNTASNSPRELPPRALATVSCAESNMDFPFSTDSRLDSLNWSRILVGVSDIRWVVVFVLPAQRRDGLVSSSCHIKWPSKEMGVTFLETSPFPRHHRYLDTYLVRNILRFSAGRYLRIHLCGLCSCLVCSRRRW